MIFLRDLFKIYTKVSNKDLIKIMNPLDNL